MVIIELYPDISMIHPIFSMYEVNFNEFL